MNVIIDGVEYQPVTNAETVSVGHLRRYARQVIEKARNELPIEITHNGGPLGVFIASKESIEVTR